MSAGTPAPNLTTLVNRITGDTVEHVLELEKSNSWLEAFLEQWIADEESFFAIALEKEELDMYVSFLINESYIPFIGINKL